MTDKELINRAKIFQGNRMMEGDKVKFADCCKIILLTDILELSFRDNGKTAEYLLSKARRKVFWRWWFH